MLILNKLSDLSLYQAALRGISNDPDSQHTLDGLIHVETQHLVVLAEIFRSFGGSVGSLATHQAAGDDHILPPQRRINTGKVGNISL